MSHHALRELDGSPKLGSSVWDRAHSLTCCHSILAFEDKPDLLRAQLYRAGSGLSRLEVPRAVLVWV